MEQRLEARRNRAYLLGHEKMTKLIFRLTIPTIIAMLINAIYNITDAAFIGTLNDNAAMGAIGIVLPLFMIINSLGLAVGIGAGSYISRSLGADNKEEANHTVSIAIVTASTLGVLTTILILIFLKPILIQLGATDTILPKAIAYARILIIASILVVANMTLNNLIRAEGNSRYSMFGIIIGAVANILLDYLFIMIFHYGIVGAAIATVIGQGISTLYLISYYFRKDAILTLNLKKFSFSSKIYAQIFSIGTPMFITSFLTSYSMILLNRSVKPFGDPAISAMVIVLRINQFILFILIGYMQGFQAIVGYNYGAKKYDRVKQSIRLSLIYTTIYSIFITIVVLIFSLDIIRFFTDDLKVIKIGVNQLIGIGLLRPFLGFLFIYQGIFQALGKGLKAGILAIGRQGIFLMSAILILPSLFTRHEDALEFFIQLLPYENDNWLIGVAYTQPFADFLGLFTTVILALTLNKELKEKIKKNKHRNRAVSS